MSYRNRTATPLPSFLSYYEAEFRFEPASKLITRTVKMTDRRTIETKERKAPPPLVSFLGATYSTTAGADTTRKWESEKVVEIEETYE
jgi:hypothetical protein